MNFFGGRYGNDQLGVFLMIVSIICEIAGALAHLRILYYLGVLLFVLMFARMFSRNIYRRQAENERFMLFWNRIRNWNYFRRQRREQKRQQQNGTYYYDEKERARNGRGGKTVYCYYYCPSCRQQVRIPAGKGKVKVTCPRCGTVFDAIS
ncbi:MAG: hypothetical protein ACOX41_07920 [Anaerovoracaceae bacterium]|jgi:ribosomal protein S27E